MNAQGPMYLNAFETFRCQSARKLCANHLHLQQIDLPTAIHLALDELELGDLTLRLTIRPRQADDFAILKHAGGERRNVSEARMLGTWLEIGQAFSRTVIWNQPSTSRASTTSGTFFGEYDRYRLGLRQIVAPTVIRRAMSLAEEARRSLRFRLAPYDSISDMHVINYRLLIDTYSMNVYEMY